MKRSTLSIELTMESTENHDFVLVDAQIDSTVAICHGCWAVLGTLENGISHFLSLLSEQEHLTVQHYDFLAAMPPADFAIAADSWDFDTKEWSFEKSCALSKKITAWAFFGCPTGPEPFIGITTYLLVHPVTRIGKLLYRGNEETEFQQFLVNIDDYISIWQKAMETTISFGAARRNARDH
nr:hypothetical protein [Rhodoferax sp.]